MPKQVVWSPASEQDIDKILEYISSNWNSRLAKLFINKVEDCIHLITENPEIFPYINQSLRIRKCVITKQNSLFYRVTHDNIEIIRVFDTRQNPNKMDLV